MNIEDAKFIETKMRLLSKEQEAVISEFEKKIDEKILNNELHDMTRTKALVFIFLIQVATITVLAYHLLGVKK
jgi:hypothetical protein